MAKRPAPAKGNDVVSLKVTLRGAKPPIWRRLLVRPETKLDDLHDAIQGAMGWMDGHLHAFDIGGRQYGPPDESGELEVADERRLTVGGAIQSGGARFTYTYDFGDDWEHIVEIEKTLPAEPGKAYPMCIAGKRACPPEDCGGVWGYEELLDILGNPKHPERAERLDWLGRDFDPEDFSAEAADARLAARLRRK